MLTKPALDIQLGQKQHTPLHQNVQTYFGIHLASDSMGNGVIFLGKVAGTWR